MDFCQEIAVFQGACLYAEKISGGLKNYLFDGGPCSEQVLQIIADSVTEICGGLIQDLSTVDARMWCARLATLCTWRTAASIRELSEMLTASETRSARKLPEWNMNLYCEMIRRNGWVGEFLKIVDKLPAEYGLVFLKEFLNYLTNNYYADDIKIIIVVVEYWTTIENKYVFTSATWDKNISSSMQFISMQMIQLLLSLLAEDNTKRVLDVVNATKAIVALLHLIAIQVNLEVFVMRNSLLNEPKISVVSLMSEHTANYDCQTTLDVDRLLSLKLVEIPVVPCKTCSVSVHVPLNGLALNVFIKLQNEIDAIVSFLTQSQSSVYCSILGLIDCDPLIWCKMYRHFFIAAYREITKHLSSIPVDCRDSYIVKCVELLRGPYDMLTKHEELLDKENKKPEIIFERVLLVIGREMAEFEESCKWLLETDCLDVVLDRRWLSCIENKLSLFGGSTEKCLNIIRSLIRWKQHIAAEDCSKLQLAILNVFGCLTLEQQEYVVEQLYLRSEHRLHFCSDLFDVDIDEFNTLLLTSLNKLVDTSDNSDMAAKSIMRFVIQRPVETIQRLINSSANYKRHVNGIAKILIRCPSMLRLMDAQFSSVAFTSIVYWLYNQEKPRQNVQNTLLLCQHLTAEFLKDSSKHRDLIENFLQSCLFVQLVQPSASLVTVEENKLTCILNVLNVVTLPLKSAQSDWSILMLYRALIVMVWISQVLHICGNKNISQQQDTAMTVELCCIGLQQLIEATSLSSVPVVALSWLYEKILECRWTIQHYFLPLFSKQEHCSKFPLMMPDSLIGFLDTSYRAVTSITTSFNGVYELVAYNCISDSTLQHTLSALRIEALQSEQNLYAKLVFSISQFLSDWDTQQWSRIYALLVYLLKHSTSVRRGSSNCSKHDVQACKMITDAIIIHLRQPFVSDRKCNTALNRVINNYSSCIKNRMTETQSNVALTVKVEIMTGVLAEVLRLLPVTASLSGPLVLLCLDLIAAIQSGNSKQGTHVENNCSNSEYGVVVANEECNLKQLLMRCLVEMNIDCDMSLLIQKLNNQSKVL